MVDRIIYTCPNGELIDTVTGEITGYLDFDSLPPISKDAQTLLYHWDGVSTEPLGTIPKIITLSRAEERLLRKLHPWKFFKMGMRSDYLRLIARMNAKQISIFRSVMMKNFWKDPNSIFNTPEYRLNKRLGTLESWIERRIKFGPSGFSAKGRMAIVLSNITRNIDLWEIRRQRYGPRGVKDPIETSKNLTEAQLRRWANGYTHPPGKIWKKRRERFGPLGHDPEVKKEADKRGWETRRKRARAILPEMNMMEHDYDAK